MFALLYEELICIGAPVADHSALMRTTASRRPPSHSQCAEPALMGLADQVTFSRNFV
jgi:hypothetical protein